MTRRVNIFQSIPFIRISLWFAAGILCHSYFSFSNLAWYILFILLLLAIILLSQKSNFRTVVLANYFTSATIFLIGAWLTQVNSLAPTEFPKEKTYYYGQILEKPIDKKNSCQTILKISNPAKNLNGKVIAYLQKNEENKQLKPGTHLLLSTKLNRIKNNGNPFEFDYATYMLRQGITHSAYLKNQDIAILGSSDRNLFIWAERFRDYLLSILRKHQILDEEYTVVAALTLGYRKELNPETRDYFSSTGAMHVLAVSGLHVGIIYIIFTFLFSPLKRKKHGRVAFTVLVGTLIWVYAILAGLSPSVQRAAIMFSFILIGQNMNRPTNIFNSLAASAFVLMLFNPQIIFEVGFQLSYLAVTGIVLFQPLFSQIYKPKNRLLDKLWTLLTVSLAAQLATCPLGLFYFSQFPCYFWLSNFIAIPAATVILGGTFLLFVVSPIPIISDWIGIAIHQITHCMLFCLKKINSLPFAVTENISLSSIQTIILLLLIASTYWFIKTKSIRELRVVILLFGGLFLSSFVQNVRLLNQRKIIVYNSEYPVIHFIHGRNSYILFDSAKTDTDQITRLTNVVINQLKLNTPTLIPDGEKSIFANNELLIKPKEILFSGKKLQFGISKTNKIQSSNKAYSSAIRNKRLIDYSGETTIIVGKNNLSEDKIINIYQTSKKGAFIADFKDY